KLQSKIELVYSLVWGTTGKIKQKNSLPRGVTEIKNYFLPISETLEGMKIPGNTMQGSPIKKRSRTTRTIFLILKPIIPNGTIETMNFSISKASGRGSMS